MFLSHFFSKLLTFKWPYRIHSRWFLAAPFPAGRSGCVGTPLLLRPPSTGRLQLLSGNHKLPSVLRQHFPCSFSYPYWNLQMRNESKNLSLRTLIVWCKSLLGYLYAFALLTCCYILWLERSIICAVIDITLWRWNIWRWCFIRAWGSIWAATAEGCKMCLKSRELSGQVVWLKPDPEIVTIVSSTPSWVTPGLVTYPVLFL